MILKPTEEQDCFCRDRSRRILGRAFAGSGKTTSFVMRAKLNVLSSLYLAFNKAIQLEAEAKFPSHVRCRTGHSIAFAKFGKKYIDDKNKLQANIKSFQVKGLLCNTLKSMPQSMHLLYCSKIIDAVKRFLVSDSFDLSLSHFEFDRNKESAKYYDSRIVLSDMNLVWDEMRNVRNTEIPMIHDGYFKEFHLSRPRLPFDVIYFDEVQDTNPITQSIINMQDHAQIIYVGDEHQSIYSFRGAMNAINELNVDSTHYLTTSFRFGQKVADVANAILDLKGESKRITGLGVQGLVSCDPATDRGLAYISRGNGALFARAVEAIENGQRFDFLGDLKGYQLELINDVHNLRYGMPTRDPLIKSFSSYDELCEYADSTDDRELISRIKVVEQYERKVPELICSIEHQVKEVRDNPVKGEMLLLTTAHKSKGAEFDVVQLADDYKSFFEDDDGINKLVDIPNISPSDVEEFNLQYVAATRAKKKLYLSQQISELLSYEGKLRNITR